MASKEKGTEDSKAHGTRYTHPNMPEAIAFDTHAVVKQLTAVGFTEEQAEAQTAVVARLLQQELATKGDLEALRAHVDIRLKELETGLKRDIKDLDTKLETRVKEMELRMTVRLGALMAATAGIVATLVKLL
jgi:hypothetical protein